MPLANYLRGLPASQKEVTLTFRQIENILAGQLPSSAYEDERWWEHETEGNHVTRRAWSQAGWRVHTLDVAKKWVEFVRAG